MHLNLKLRKNRYKPILQCTLTILLQSFPKSKPNKRRVHLKSVEKFASANWVLSLFFLKRLLKKLISIIRGKYSTEMSKELNIRPLFHLNFMRSGMHTYWFVIENRILASARIKKCIQVVERTVFGLCNKNSFVVCFPINSAEVKPGSYSTKSSLPIESPLWKSSSSFDSTMNSDFTSLFFNWTSKDQTCIFYQVFVIRKGASSIN